MKVLLDLERDDDERSDDDYLFVEQREGAPL